MYIKGFIVPHHHRFKLKLRNVELKLRSRRPPERCTEATAQINQILKCFPMFGRGECRNNLNAAIGRNDSSHTSELGMSAFPAVTLKLHKDRPVRGEMQKSG